MRKGFLCSLALLAGSGVASAQGFAPGGQPGMLPPPGHAAGPYGPGLMTPPAYPRQPAAPYVPTPYAKPAGSSGAPGVASSLPAEAPAGGPVEPDILYADVGQELTPIYPALPDDGAPPRPHPDRWWVGADALVGWVKPGTLAPLVTTGSTADASPGALGQPGTSVLLGDQNLDSIRVGARANVGYWLDCDRHYAIEASGFYLLPARQRFVVSSDNAGNPLLIRPAFDALNQQEVGFLIAQPGVAAGSTTTETRSELWGWEANLRKYHTFSAACRGELLAGYRTLRLDESLSIVDRVRPLEQNVLTFQRQFVNPPNALEDLDRFDASNRFYGVQLGGALHMQHTWCFLDLFGKVGLGTTQQTVDIAGQTNLVTPEGRLLAQGGILAQTSNIGRQSRYVFGVVPEAGFNVGVDAFQHVRLRAGYSILVWNSVVRPGDQIDRAVNPALVPSDQSFGSGLGPARPAFTFRDQVFWVHSLNLGFELHY